MSNMRRRITARRARAKGPQDTHPCPIDGCTIEVPNRQLLCIRHWRQVPAEQSRELYAAYRAAQQAQASMPRSAFICSPQHVRHRAAMRECIRAVHAAHKGEG